MRAIGELPATCGLPASVETAIIGAGFGGVGAGIRLKQQV